MSPRAYKLGQRQAAVDETRARIVLAARALLAAQAFDQFTIDAVARHAGVARMTVYYQFGSKNGLLEALFDDLAGRGLVDRLRASFAHADPFDALGAFIGAFVGFWASDRVVIRRLRGLAALDTAIESGLRARDGRRRDGLQVLVRRLAQRYSRPVGKSVDEIVDVLHTLTSFETFDALAGTSRTPEEVATLLIRVAHAVTIADAESNRRSPGASPR